MSVKLVFIIYVYHRVGKALSHGPDRDVNRPESQILYHRMQISLMWPNSARACVIIILLCPNRPITARVARDRLAGALHTSSWRHLEVRSRRLWRYPGQGASAYTGARCAFLNLALPHLWWWWPEAFPPLLGPQTSPTAIQAMSMPLHILARPVEPLEGLLRQFYGSYSAPRSGACHHSTFTAVFKNIWAVWRRPAS